MLGMQILVISLVEPDTCQQRIRTEFEMSSLKWLNFLGLSFRLISSIIFEILIVFSAVSIVSSQSCISNSLKET